MSVSRGEKELAEWYQQVARDEQNMLPAPLVVKCWFFQQQRIYRLENELREAKLKLEKITIKRRFK